MYGLASLSKGSLPRVMIIGIFGFFLLIILLGVISFSKGLTAPVRRLAASIIPAKILAVIENIREGIYQYRGKKKEMLFTLVLTFFLQAILIFNTSILIMGIYREALLLGVSRLYTAYRDREHVDAFYAQRHGNP